MKKGTIVGLILILFFINLVSAVTCDEDQRIFKLYQENNSHASIWQDHVLFIQETGSRIRCENDWNSTHPCENIYDNDENTYGVHSGINLQESGRIYIDYAKPAGAIRESSFWQIKTGDSAQGGIFNKTLSIDCWNSGDVLNVGLHSYFAISGNPLTSDITYYCDGYKQSVVNDVSYPHSDKIYEERMIWNLTNSYAEDVCYDDFFSSYNGLDPHVCVGDVDNPTNAIFWLSAEGNSHASTNKVVGSYEIPICYGDLVCRYVDESAGENCNQAGEEIIASLYQSTNSHIAKGDFAGYDIKVCCRPGFKITGAQWKDNNDNLIANTNLNSLVKLAVEGMSLTGQEIDYEIKKERRFWFDKKIAETSEMGFLKWRAGLDQDTGLLEDGTYYFIATLPDKTDHQSGDLIVSDIEKNIPPVPT